MIDVNTGPIMKEIFYLLVLLFVLLSLSACGCETDLDENHAESEGGSDSEARGRTNDAGDSNHTTETDAGNCIDVDRDNDCLQVDCNDRSSTVGPSQSETCGNGSLVSRRHATNGNTRTKHLLKPSSRYEDIFTAS